MKGGKKKVKRTEVTLEILDQALTAAEGVLGPAVKEVSPINIARAFELHTKIHLYQELLNIRKHGHRNDEAGNRPPLTPFFATVEGGVVTDIFRLREDGTTELLPYQVVDWDHFEQDADEFWSRLSPELRVYISKKLPNEWIRMESYLCDCTDRSWFGPEHDTLCVLASHPKTPVRVK